MLEVYRFSVILIVLLMATLVELLPAERNETKNTHFKIRVTKAYCIDMPYEVAWNVTCRLKLMRDQPSRMTFSVTVGYIDQMYLSFAMFYKYHMTYQPLLMATTFDVCSYVKKYNSRKSESSQPIDLDQTAFYVMRVLERNNPAPIRNACPYRGVVSFENMIIDESMAPKFIPAGDYRLDMRYFNEKNQTVMHSQVYGSVRAVGIVDLSMG